MTVTGTTALYRTRPKYMILTSAHHWVPGRTWPGIRTPNRAWARVPGAARRPWVHGPSASQLPNGDTSCASARSGEASRLVTSTATSPVAPGASRSAGVSTARSSSAAMAAVLASTAVSAWSSGWYRSGSPGPPAWTNAVSSMTWPRSSEICAATT